MRTGEQENRRTGEWEILISSGAHVLFFVVFFLISLLAPGVVKAQIHPLSDQYQMNLFQLNPAVAGLVTLDPLVVNTRQSTLSWHGYNPPHSASVTFHAKFFKERSYFNPRGMLNRGKNSFGKVGLGAGFFNYSYGAVRQSGIHLDYAYHVFVGEGRLSFGLAPVLVFFRANFTGDRNLIFHDPGPDDVWQPGEDVIKLSFLDFNAGVHYFSNTLTAGLSCIQLLNSELPFQGAYGLPNSVDPFNPDMSRTVYGYAGYAFRMTNGLYIEPFLLLKYNDHDANRFRADLSTTVYVNDNLQAGLTYRVAESGAAFFGIRYNQFQIRYQFDFPLNGTRPLSFFAHTIQLGFDPGFLIN